MRRTPSTVSGMHELTQTVEVEASIDELWKDVTDAERLTRWFWPERLEPSAKVDPVVSGEWTVRSPVGGFAVKARVLELDPPRALTLAWRWSGEATDAVTTAALTFTERDASTRVTVHHRGFATEGERDQHVQGWADCLERWVERWAR